MVNTKSRRGRYMLAAVLGVAAGGVVVKIAPRVLPKMISAMCGKMHSLMSEMTGADAGAGDGCQLMMGAMGQVTQQSACHTPAEPAGAFEQREHLRHSVEDAGCVATGCDGSPLV